MRVRVRVRVRARVWLDADQPDVGMGAEGVEQCAQRVAAHEGVVVEEEEVGAW